MGAQIANTSTLLRIHQKKSRIIQFVVLIEKQNKKKYFIAHYNLSVSLCPINILQSLNISLTLSQVS